MIKISFFFLLMLIGCSHTLETTHVDPENIYQGAGVEQYFLPELPAWANSSQVGHCQKSVSIRYLDFSKLTASYSFSYFENVQLQLSFNKSIQLQKKNNEKGALFLKDEVYLFSNSYEQINGRAYEMSVPDFNRLHLIWIDRALSDSRTFQKLKILMNSNSITEGYPIFISSCLGDEDLQNFIDKNFSNLGIRKISAEFFNSYSADNKLMFGLNFDLDSFFGKKMIYLFGPDEYPPVNITGFREYKKF